MGLAAFLTAVTVATMTPEQKAAAVVASGLPAPPGVGGVLVHRSQVGAPRPPGALVFVDQEGGDILRVHVAAAGGARLRLSQRSGSAGGGPRDRPRAPAQRRGRGSRAGARRAGRAARRAALPQPGARARLRPRPVTRRRRGLREAFPGLGSAAASTDDESHVAGALRSWEVAGFLARDWPCVMVGHAFYPSLGSFRASMEPSTYELLRARGFDGVAITDSLSVVRRPPRYWPRRAIRAGADMLLFSSPARAPGDQRPRPARPGRRARRGRRARPQPASSPVAYMTATPVRKPPST